MQFFREEPTATSAWRMAILMGVNTRTYKFALGQALLETANSGSESVSLADLAVPYALSLTKRAQNYPQAPKAESLGEQDFLTILSKESQETLKFDSPTVRLVDAAVKSMPMMVMQKFHNMSGGAVPHTFYEIEDLGTSKIIRFTPSLCDVIKSGKVALLSHEIDTRWSLVESSFDSGIGASLRSVGLLTSDDGEYLIDHIRRGQVSKSRAALIGFQHGRCLLCMEPIENLYKDVHVDHTYPYSLMKRLRWKGPDLNGIWNLAVTHSVCNSNKSNTLPSSELVQRLIERNEAIANSPHPLRRTIEILVGITQNARLTFIKSVDQNACSR